MSELTDIDALAAEYVLGTLDAAERTAVSARRQREVELDQAIAAWELRLSPLVHAAQPLQPPAGLLAGIQRRLDMGDVRASAVVALPIADAQNLQKRLRRWRNSTLAASAIAASLLVGLVWRETTRSSLAQNYVAVFQKDDASPSFLLSVDLATRTLSVRRVSAEVPPGKTYQLWIAADQLGQGPQSLGLVEDQNTAVREAISKIDPAIVQKALFGVSLEPAGGSPTGKPTGPVFHARLIPATL